MASITTFFGAQGGGGSVSGTLGQVAYFDGTDSVAGTNSLYWDDTEKGMIVGGLAPSQGDALGRINLYGYNDAGGSLINSFTGALWGGVPVFRVLERGVVFLSSNSGAIGTQTLNIFIGDPLIGSLTTDQSLMNVAIGHPAATTGRAPGRNLTTGDNNLLIGASAGSSIDTGSSNIGLGSGSIELLTSGTGNVVAGVIAGRNLTTGSSNSFFGYFSGRDATTSDSNSAIGLGSLSNVVSTGDNTAAGIYAGAFKGAATVANTNCSQCVYLGGFTRSKSSGAPTNEIVIGYNAIGNGSDSVTLGHTTVTNTYLRGDINLVEGGDVVLGTSTGTQIGTSASQKLAFYGDTPDVQPTTAITGATFATGGGGVNIKTDDTFGGYTIAQIAAALIRLGLLA